MTSWEQFATADKSLSDFGKERLEHRISYLATIRPDGSPRVHPVSPFIVFGRLFLYMEPTSPKSSDLRRDPRFSIHCSIEDNSGGKGEFLIRGRAKEMLDQKTRESVFSSAEDIGFQPQERYVLFELMLTEARSTVYQDGEPVRSFWKAQQGEQAK